MTVRGEEQVNMEAVGIANHAANTNQQPGINCCLGIVEANLLFVSSLTWFLKCCQKTEVSMGRVKTTFVVSSLNKDVR